MQYLENFADARRLEMFIETLPAGEIQILLLSTTEFDIIPFISTFGSVLSMGYGIQNILCKSNDLPPSARVVV